MQFSIFLRSTVIDTTPNSEEVDEGEVQMQEEVEREREREKMKEKGRTMNLASERQTRHMVGQLQVQRR